jgi:hypothetical protein
MPAIRCEDLPHRGIHRKPGLPSSKVHRNDTGGPTSPGRIGNNNSEVLAEGFQREL